MKRLAALVPVAMLLTAALACQTTPAPRRSSRSLEPAVAYLRNVPGVAWIHVNDNRVGIGWKSRPSDLGVITRAAAVNGNRALGFGVHVWSVNAKGHTTPTDPTTLPIICTATARNGKVTDSDCGTRL